MTKERILEKSLELFATKGYFDCSMDDISKAVEIKKASLYFHFPSKESIFQAVFQKIIENYSVFINGITAAGDDMNTVEKLSGIFRKYVKNCVNNYEMAFWDRYYYYPPDIFKDELHRKTYQIEMDFIDKIQKIVLDGIRRKEIKPLDAQSLALSFYYMMIGLAMGVNFYGDDEIDDKISRCLDVYLAGIRAE